MSESWMPKPGDPVKYICRSSIGQGRLVNVQAMVVTKVTPAGFVYVNRRSSKFKPGAKDNTLFEHRTKEDSRMSLTRSTLEPISAEEAALLPQTDVAGARFAQGRA